VPSFQNVISGEPGQSSASLATALCTCTTVLSKFEVSSVVTMGQRARFMLGLLAADEVPSGYTADTSVDCPMWRWRASRWRSGYGCAGSFCDQVRCPTRTFAEQIPGLTSRYGRRSPLLQRSLEKIGLALAGRAGARLADRLGFLTSRSIVLRLVRALGDPVVWAVDVDSSRAPFVLGHPQWTEALTRYRGDTRPYRSHTQRSL
jgi:hypothetical protein